MPTVDADATRHSLSFERLIPALQEAFTADCHVPTRHHHHPVGNCDDSTLLLMPVWGGAYMGVKVVSVFPNNSKQDLPSLNSSYLLCDAETGRHLALIDGNQITTRRTAAASALAASFLARDNAQVLLILGASRVGSLLASAYRSIRPIEHVLIWTPFPAEVERLVQNLRRDGFNARGAGDLESAVQSADCITAATLSTEPLIRGEWLQPGVHVDLIGSFTPQMREADDQVFAVGKVFVDVPGAIHESGDLIDPIANGVLKESDICADLERLCRKQHPGRSSDSEITVYKAVGTAAEDLTSAKLVYEDHRR